MTQSELIDFLNSKVDQYNRTDFIDTDPVQIPHLFIRKEDQEIAGFLAATIAWGQRTTIIKNAHLLLQLMDNSPHDFITSASDGEISRLDRFVHRTFNGTDAITFVYALRHIYTNHGGLEGVFKKGFESQNAAKAISHVRKVFFEIDHPQRTEKHFANPEKGSSAKRINMFLRWMVRRDDREVDLGIWNSISPAHLDLPLDVHTGNVSRKLGLLHRKQNDYKAVEEVMRHLCSFDPTDPVKYDFALFGLGVFEDLR